MKEIRADLVLAEDREFDDYFKNEAVSDMVSEAYKAGKEAKLDEVIRVINATLDGYRAAREQAEERGQEIKQRKRMAVVSELSSMKEILERRREGADNNR